jgi:endonuclease YncB( thermonuclease family)
MLRLARLLLGSTLLSTSALADRRDAETADLSVLPELLSGPVASVPDGATLVLADGTGVRLAGIEPVLAAPGGARHWEDAARTLLASLVAGHDVSLRGAAAPPDRYGRMTAQLVRDDGLWLEGALLEAGAVRVEPPAPMLAGPMLAREAEARRQHLGLWQSPLYAVRRPAELGRDSGSFVLVETRIESAEIRNGSVWLDLGSGAAARLDRPARHLFEAAGLDPLRLAGQTLRLRGWIRWQGRPVLDLAYPEAVEISGVP